MQAGILGCSQTLKTSFLASKAICNCSQTKHYSHFVLLFLMLNIAFTFAISAAFEESLSWGITVCQIRPLSAVYKESDCRSRGHKFDPGPVPYY